MTCTAEWTSHGGRALGALAAAVRSAQAGDPLAPITVVTPSPAVAVATRRALARRLGGSAGVSFHALGAVAEQLAAPALGDVAWGAGVDRELLVTAVRATLADRPGRFAPIAGHRATWERLADAVVEVDSLDDAGLAAVRSAGSVPAEVVRLRSDVRQRLGPLGRDAVTTLAVEVATAGGPAVDALGTVIVHLPERFAPAELALLARIAVHRPVHLLLGTTGDAALDGSLAEHVTALVDTAPPTAEPAAATEIVSANDVDDEVRVAVRRLLALADAGTPVHRMALVHPPGPPYAGVVADVLGAAGVPCAGPSTRRLAQTVAGRVLLGVLEVAGSRFGRQEVVDLWASGVVVDEEGPLPGAAFDERTRRLGIIRDVSRWRQAIEDDGARLRRRAEASPGDPGLGWIDHRLRLDGRLLGALATLEQMCASLPRTWPEVAAWAGSVVDGLCGTVATRASWPEVEIDADGAVRLALARLAALHELEPEPSPPVVRDTIRTALDAPAPRAGRTGDGLVVTTIDAPPLVPLHAVAVVGLAEGHLPRVAPEDALLGERLRRQVGLPAAEDVQCRQRRALLAALGSASTHRIATFPRNDQRSGRAIVPSRWLVDLVEQRTGCRPDTEALMAGAEVDGVDCVASHGAGLADVLEGRTAALHEGELALASLVAAGCLDGHPAATDPVLAAGAELVRARRSHDFTRFDGNLGGDGVDVGELGLLSPTSIETYASCPRRWFFAHALQLQALDRPEEIDRIDGRERGTLAHRVLERFFAEVIADGSAPPPGQRWSPEARERMRAIADEECDAAEARGVTGHPRWWEHDRAEIHRVLQRTLTGDEEQRAEMGTAPVAVELSFGRGGAPPLEVDLGDGRRLRLAGQADRVDVAARPDGGARVVVWDYKYGSPRAFQDLVRPDDRGGDPLAAGTKIQLVAYGMAAAASPVLGLDAGRLEVHARYWFLRPPDTGLTIGYEVDDELRRRFAGVLGVVADGVSQGRFPARPGLHQYHLGTFEHCAWCDFDAICPRDRDEEWERVRDHPSLRPVRRLAEEGSSSVLDPDGRRP